MKKRVTALVLALALSLGMCVSASAASFVPDDVMMATYTHTAASLRRSRPSMSRIATQRL